MKRILFSLLLSFSAANPAFAADCEETLFQDLPRYAQKADFTCGAVCVRSVLEYMRGLRFTEEALGQAMGTYQFGYTPPLNMQRLLAFYGLRSEFAFEGTIEDLRAYMRDGETLIVSITLDGVGHYAAVKSIGPTHVTLMDPWIARENRDQVLTLEEFDRMWTITFGRETFRGSVLRVFKN